MKRKKKRGGSPLFSIILILFLKAFILIAIAETAKIGLGPDEAQYWSWSRKLDWGYYSKPPGIAWQIWFGTHLFGDTAIGVRSMSVFIGFLLPLFVYALARACRLKQSTAFWAGIMMGFSPIGILSSILATTDAPMVLFWILATIIVAKSLSTGTPPSYPLVGVTILFGAFFKWPIYLFWVFPLIAMFGFKQLRSLRILIGMGISLIGLLPSVYWNVSHSYATFRHVLATMIGGHANKGTGPLGFFQGNPAAFIGAQVSLLSPVLFILLLIALGYMVKHHKKVWPSLVFCGGMTLILLSVYTALACVQKMQGNWCVFAYPSGIVLLSWFCCEQVSWGKKWMIAGIILSFVLSLFVLSLPFLQEKGLTTLPYRVNPFRHNLGWNRLKSALEKAGYDPKIHFLFGDKYQTTSIATFYSLGKKQAYFFNLQGVRKNQFSYWPGMAEQQEGKNGFFVLPEHSPQLDRIKETGIDRYIAELQPYFEKVEYLGEMPLFYCNSAPVKEVFIFKCLNYNGKKIVDPELY